MQPPMQQPPIYQQMPYYPPHHHLSGEPPLGSKERPLVVIPAPAPKSWFSRLWVLLLFLIGVSAMLHLIEEYEARTSDVSSPSKPGMSGGLGGRGGGIGNMFGSQEIKPVDLESQEISFDNVRGCDEAKEELEEIVEFLKNPKKFVTLGGRLPKGALLVGPPGCGKTMLAKAIAKEAGVKFFYATGSEFDEMFVGVGARRVRELFAAAKANSPSLIFIDEIDALGGKRSKSDHAYSRMTLNQLLAEMDGFQSSDEVIVLAATNTPDALDKALTRPGRFDFMVSVDAPDQRGRVDILDFYLGKIKRDLTVKALDIARGTAGFTGAELSNLVNVAAIRAAVLDKTAVTSDDIEYAKDRVMMGMENKSKIIPPEEKKITAFHEGGHALVAMLLEKDGTDPVHKATIIPRGNGIMGLVQQQPLHDRYSMNKSQCLSRIKVCLAGRVAEEMLLGHSDVTTGAASDFQQATRMATNMIRKFGFSDTMGTIDFESADTAEGAYMSDATKERIEREVQGIVKQAYKETQEMLLHNKHKLEIIAQNLLQHETLTGDELKRILAGEVLPVKEKPVKKPRNSSPPKGGQKVSIPVNTSSKTPAATPAA
jgi:ATP-dependent metalloprotease